MVPLLALLNCAALLRNSPAPRSACLRCSVAAPPATTAEAAPPSLYPAWPLALSEKPELQDVIDAFEETSTAVPLRAAFEEGDGWRVWSDGGFAIQKFLAAKAMSRALYPAILACLRGMMVQSQAKYPDLYAVLKFVPKKNGLNPLLAQIDEGADASAPSSICASSGLSPFFFGTNLSTAYRSGYFAWLCTIIPRRHARIAGYNARLIAFAARNFWIAKPPSLHTRQPSPSSNAARSGTAVDVSSNASITSCSSGFSESASGHAG